MSSNSTAGPNDVAFDGVLFDLDGTLVDTAPDMVAVLHDMQAAHGEEPVDYSYGRSNVSNGALGLLGIGFPDREIVVNSALHLDFLERYEQRICVDSCLFDGLAPLLDTLEAAGKPWGIVTNKPGHLTAPLLKALGLFERSACNVSGDTLPVRKPDPAPLLHACEIGALQPGRTLYVGDAARDIQAGRAAGMTTIAALYGYITEDDSPGRWGADFAAADTAELAQLIIKAVSLDA